MTTNPRPDFQNTEIAFKHLSDHDLYRAWSLFRTINFKPLVIAGPPMLTAALKLRLPIKPLVRATVFKQFCGGGNSGGLSGDHPATGQGRCLQHS